MSSFDVLKGQSGNAVDCHSNVGCGSADVSGGERPEGLSPFSSLSLVVLRKARSAPPFEVGGLSHVAVTPAVSVDRRRFLSTAPTPPRAAPGEDRGQRGQGQLEGPRSAGEATGAVGLRHGSPSCTRGLATTETLDRDGAEQQRSPAPGARPGDRRPRDGECGWPRRNRRRR